MSWYNDGIRNSPIPNGNLPDESGIVAQLHGMDNAKLQQLYDNDEEIKKMVMESSQIKSINQEKQRLTNSNKSIAEQNIALEPRLETAKHRLIESHEKLNESKSNYNTLKAKIDSLGEKFSSDTVLALLQAATAEAEDQSEGYANEFLSGSIDVDKFLENFLPLRKLYNERRIKCEKMGEIASSANRGTNMPPMHAPSFSGPQAPPQFQMPMPNVQGYTGYAPNYYGGFGGR